MKTPQTHPAEVMDKGQVWLQRIMLSDVLTSNGITYQTTDVSYNVSTHMASPLEQQLGGW